MGERVSYPKEGMKYNTTSNSQIPKEPVQSRPCNGWLAWCHWEEATSKYLQRPALWRSSHPAKSQETLSLHIWKKKHMDSNNVLLCQKWIEKLFTIYNASRPTPQPTPQKQGLMNNPYFWRGTAGMGWVGWPAIKMRIYGDSHASNDPKRNAHIYFQSHWNEGRLKPHFWNHEMIPQNWYPP